MSLKKKEIELLKRQGLEADIRNQLSVAKNIPLMFKKYKKEKDPEIKEGILQILNNSIKKLEKSVDHILSSLSYFETKEKKSP